jgi:hypothetical protein
MQAHKEGISGSQSYPARRNTASSLLARILPNQKFEHKMAAANHTLKPKAYAQYDGPGDQSADELDQIIYADRKSLAGHSLRPRKSLALSMKAAENGDKTKSKAASVCLSLFCLSTFNFKSKAFTNSFFD